MCMSGCVAPRTGKKINCDSYSCCRYEGGWAAADSCLDALIGEQNGLGQGFLTPALSRSPSKSWPAAPLLPLQHQGWEWKFYFPVQLSKLGTVCLASRKGRIPWCTAVCWKPHHKANPESCLKRYDSSACFNLCFLLSQKDCLCFQACSWCLEGRMHLSCPKLWFTLCAAHSLLQGTGLMWHFQPGLKPPVSVTAWVECGFAEADDRVKLPCVPSQRCCSTVSAQVVAPLVGDITSAQAQHPCHFTSSQGSLDWPKKHLALSISRGYSVYALSFCLPADQGNL